MITRFYVVTCLFGYRTNNPNEQKRRNVLCYPDFHSCKVHSNRANEWLISENQHYNNAELDVSDGYKIYHWKNPWDDEWEPSSYGAKYIVTKLAFCQHVDDFIEERGL